MSTLPTSSAGVDRPASAIAAPPPMPYTHAAPPVDPGVEARWAAWQTRGREHDAAFRRKLRIVLPIGVAALAVVLFIFLSR